MVREHAAVLSDHAFLHTRRRAMSNFERYLPVHAVIVIGAMYLHGVTLAGVACVASVVLYFYLKIR